jgi:hypothetical protein
MRTWGRIPNPYPPSGVEDTSEISYPNAVWIEVATTADGDNDYVYITALIQTLKLNLNESPFYAQFGIPAADCVMQQVQPDYYVSFIQAYYSQFFASLIIAKQPQAPTNSNFTIGSQPYTTPIYNVSIIRLSGSKFQAQVGL